MFQVEVFQTRRDGSWKQDCTNMSPSLFLLSPILCQTPKKNHNLQEILLPSFPFLEHFPSSLFRFLPPSTHLPTQSKTSSFWTAFAQEGQQQPGGPGHSAVTRQPSLRTPPAPIRAVLAKLLLAFRKALQAGTNSSGGTEQYGDNSCSLFFNL